MWWIFSSLASITQTSRNVVMKSLGHKLDEYINVWGRFTFLLPFAFILSAYHGFPKVGSYYWFFSILAGFLQVIATIFLSKAFKHGDISMSVAIWKLEVIFVLILGIIFLGEKITYLSVIGIIITVLGVYLLNIEKSHISFLEPIKHLFKSKDLRFALLSAIAISPTVILFKETILLSDPYFSTLTNYTFASIFMFMIVFRTSKKSFPRLKKFTLQFIILGLTAFISSILTSFAYKMVPAAYVEAVEQLELLFTATAGVIFFNEHQRVKEIWMGCCVIIFGIVLVIFGS